MIDVYSWPTPNGQKIHIMLEELELPNRIIPVNIMQGDQFKPEFLRISPNNKIPAIVDHDGHGGESCALFESGAILIYLADKSSRFLPPNGCRRYETIQWLMFQMAHVGPFFGQAHHFRKFAKDRIPYAMERYTNETGRLYKVMDKQLSDREYLAGDYSIADMATFPWVIYHEWQGQDLADFPNVKRWFEAIHARPAVKRGLDVKDFDGLPGAMPDDDAVREILFGNKQYQRN
jgi:GST-like protein